MATKLKKKINKSSFSLMAGPLPPPPLNGPVIKRRTFFYGFPNDIATLEAVILTLNNCFSMCGNCIKFLILQVHSKSMADLSARMK